MLRSTGRRPILIETAGGVGYAVTVPLGVLERLPATGERVSLYTELVVREDAWSLYGFDHAGERAIFQRLLYRERLRPQAGAGACSRPWVRSARCGASSQRDLAALSTVSGIGRKKAEQLVVELGDRFKDVPADSRVGRPVPARRRCRRWCGSATRRGRPKTPCAAPSPAGSPTPPR